MCKTRLYEFVWCRPTLRSTLSCPAFSSFLTSLRTVLGFIRSFRANVVREGNAFLP